MTIVIIRCIHSLQSVTHNPYCDRFPENTDHSLNAVSMLAHRLRRWPNIEQHWVNVPCLLGYLYREAIPETNSRSKAGHCGWTMWMDYGLLESIYICRYVNVPCIYKHRGHSANNYFRKIRGHLRLL